jgi:hypothetical protein
MIRKIPNHRLWRIYSISKPRRNLGTFPSKALAIKHERQIEFFKHRASRR